MDNFKYNNPTKVLFGKNTIELIGEEIANFGVKKILLLAGSGSIKQNNVYNQTIESLKRNGIEWVESWGVIPNPILPHAEESLNKLREFGAEAVLAVGGGSVIDEAKAIAAGYYLDNIWALYEGGSARLTKALPLFVIQTLSATGSEMNSYSVLTKPEDQKKWAFGSPYTYPKVSIIDPSVQMTLPWRQTVNGGVDSLSHVMESYFGGIDEETTLSINEALMNSVIKSIDKLQIDYHNYDARADFAWASALALSGLTSLSMRGGEWVVHRIEHGISALFPQVAHAEGLAVLFPAWIRYVSPNKPGIFERWSSKIFGESTIEAGVNAFQDKLRQWQAPITLSDLGVSENDIPAIAENAFMQGPLGKIKEIHYQDMVNILRLAL